MSKIYKGNAYGKINLYLDVLDKMENGYHNIESIMQSVSLCDQITLEIEPCQEENIIEIVSSGGKIPNDKTNLVYKCANAFFEHTKLSGYKCIFFIEKNIPISAGMAGGSSDGACAMKLLNEAFNNILSHKEMCIIGAKIGADIPFCLTGGTCACRGIGDKITRLHSFSNIFLVSAIDSSSVSTPFAFSLLDEKYGTNCKGNENINLMIDAINTGNFTSVASLLYNKFESVILPLNENITKIKSIMLENGAVGALMSGSGPSVFGIFMDENSQKKALEALKNCSINAFLCKTI